MLLYVGNRRYIKLVKNFHIDFPFSKEKDLIVTGLTINAQRSTVIDFTYPFWLEHSAAVVHVSVQQS